jgi:hypothetical protein
MRPVTSGPYAFSTVPFAHSWRYDGVMKYPPPVQIPLGGTPAERLDLAFRKVLTVSKEELLKAEEKVQQQREKRRAKKKR